MTTILFLAHQSSVLVTLTVDEKQNDRRPLTSQTQN